MNKLVQKTVSSALVVAISFFAAVKSVAAQTAVLGATQATEPSNTQGNIWILLICVLLVLLLLISLFLIIFFRRRNSKNAKTTTTK